jgi:hypothetical protein
VGNREQKASLPAGQDEGLEVAALGGHQPLHGFEAGGPELEMEDGKRGASFDT